MAKRRPKKRNDRAAAARGPGSMLRGLRLPRLRAPRLEQRHFDLIGLGLIGLGAYLGFVMYGSSDAGRAGSRLADGLEWLFGRAAWFVPVALVAVGALLMLRPLIPRLAPFKAGGACLAAALLLGLAAETLGLGPDHPARQGAFHQDFMRAHGGAVGESAYWAVSTLFQRAGAHILTVCLALAGLLLITGASVAGMLRSTGRGVAAATERARRSTVRGMRPGRDREGEIAPVDELAPLEQGFEQEGTVEATLPERPFADHQELGPDEPVEPEQPAAEKEPIFGTPPVWEGDAPGSDRLPAEHQVHDAPAAAAARTPQGARRGVTEAEGLDYRLPASKLLKRTRGTAKPDTANLDQVGRTLTEALGHFGVEARVVGRVTGPHVTRFELRLAPGTKVAKVAQLKDDLAYALASTDIRILAPIPGKQAVGVEVPNSRRRMVTLGDIYQEPPSGASQLSVWLGKDISGRAVCADLAQMPHILVAGTTGSGKSVSVNAMLCSILLRATPDQVRLVLVDPKRVELNHYEDIPHLLTEVVTAPRLAANALSNLTREMENRYEVMGGARCRNLPELNRHRRSRGEPPLPYILCVIDELADLMMVAPAEVEDAIIRLAQKSRAVGIHLLLATQRPSTDIITGTIKVNIPARIAFGVSSQVDSRVILDQGGAETLLGHGDMLFRDVGSSKLQRIQGAYISEEEIAELTDAWRSQGEPELQQELLEAVEPIEEEQRSDDPAAGEDDRLADAIAVVVALQTASVSQIQRRLGVGYTRAGRIIDQLERRGIISGYEGSKPRQVLIAEGEVPRALAELGGEREALEPQPVPAGDEA